MKPVHLALVVIAIIAGMWFLNQYAGTPPEGSKAEVASECRVDGCSATACVDKDAPSFNTTCEWRKEYACYRIARCEVQKDGKCGWTQTLKLKACLQ